MENPGEEWTSRQGVHPYISEWTSRQGVHHYINEWTPPPGCALVHQPMDCMARRPIPSKISQDDLQNPKKVSPKSQKSVSRTWKNEAPVQVGCAATTSPNGLLVPFFKHKCAPQISKKVSPKSRKSVSKISKKCLQNLQKVSPKRLTVGSPLGDVRMHTLKVESIR